MCLGGLGINTGYKRSVNQGNDLYMQKGIKVQNYTY